MTVLLVFNRSTAYDVVGWTSSSPATDPRVPADAAVAPGFTWPTPTMPLPWFNNVSRLAALSDAAAVSNQPAAILLAAAEAIRADAPLSLLATTALTPNLVVLAAAAASRIPVARTCSLAPLLLSLLRLNCRRCLRVTERCSTRPALSHLPPAPTR